MFIRSQEILFLVASGVAPLPEELQPRGCPRLTQENSKPPAAVQAHNWQSNALASKLAADPFTLWEAASCESLNETINNETSAAAEEIRIAERFWRIRERWNSRRSLVTTKEERKNSRGAIYRQRREASNRQETMKL